LVQHSGDTNPCHYSGQVCDAWYVECYAPPGLIGAVLIICYTGFHVARQSRIILFCLSLICVLFITSLRHPVTKQKFWNGQARRFCRAFRKQFRRLNLHDRIFIGPTRNICSIMSGQPVLRCVGNGFRAMLFASRSSRSCTNSFKGRDIGGFSVASNPRS
jgi:hypothetical protein